MTRTKYKDAAERGKRTAKWATTMTRVTVALANRNGARWQAVGFVGRGKRESRGIVDLLVVRKDHGTPPAGLNVGDRLELVLVQVKGGRAAWPTDDDIARLRRVARLHRAQAVILSVWKKGEKPDLYALRSGHRDEEGRRGWWKNVEAEEVFGQSASRRDK